VEADRELMLEDLSSLRDALWRIARYAQDAGPGSGSGLSSSLTSCVPYMTAALLCIIAPFSSRLRGGLTGATVRAASVRMDAHLQALSRAVHTPGIF